MMQSLVFGLRVVTSAYYSLQKWDQLQTNHFLRGVKLYIKVIITLIQQCKFHFSSKSHPTEQTPVPYPYCSVSS